MVPGYYFCPGLDQEWYHSRQGLRMNYVPETEKSNAAVPFWRKRWHALIAG